MGDANARAARYRAFDQQMVVTTQAINAGELDQAREHLDQAGREASSPGQQQMVRSLQRLVDGAEALRNGDPDRARDEWARIDEPRLRREVRHKARLIGMDVPKATLEDGTTQ